MIGVELPCTSAAEVARVVRALGAHRYVKGRLLLLHAAVLDAVSGAPLGEHEAVLADALEWSKGVLASTEIDGSSRDERLHRNANEKEVAAVLELLWGPERKRVAARLRSFLLRHDLDEMALRIPFDEGGDEAVFPMLIDAGWELLPLAELDEERHRGAIEAWGERIGFESARFEETSRVPFAPTLQELAAIGPAEALRAVDDDGVLGAPLVLWTEGDPIYLDYVLRGVLRAAKLSPGTP